VFIITKSGLGIMVLLELSLEHGGGDKGSNKNSEHANK
jgi:hypothetical protein